MAGENSLLHPSIVWAQRKDVILLTIRLEDTIKPDIELEENTMKFRSKGGHDQKEYGFEFTFYSNIIPEQSKQHITTRELAFVLKKKDDPASYWPRLLKTTDRITFLKTDFDKWRDEDDSDDDSAAVNDNFEDMMRQMGDMPGNDGFGGGDAETEDSDDDDMPDLEEKSTTD